MMAIGIEPGPRSSTDLAAAWQTHFARLLLGLLLLLTLLPATVAAQSRGAAEVFGVRFGVNDDITRIVLDVDAATRFATRVLPSPPRLVIELENVRWQLRSHPQGRPVGIATRVNYSTLDANGSGAAGRGRLVIDVDRPFRILRHEHLPPSADAAHHRILVDLVPLETTTAAAQPPAAQPPSAQQPISQPPAVQPPVTQPPVTQSPAAQPPATRQPAAQPPSRTTSANPPRTPIAGPPKARPNAEITTADLAPSATGQRDITAAEPAAVAQLPLPGTAGRYLPATGPNQPESPMPPEGQNTLQTQTAGQTAPQSVDPTADDGDTTLAMAPLRPAPAPPARRRVITLDPGHGGADPGTVGINGVLEKEVTLDLAKRLGELIEATGRYEVVLTRDTDTFVSLRDRMETARRSNAALFISIHADSLGDSRFRGASVYTLSDQASDAEAARLATKENRADVIAGTDLSAHDEIVAGILIDLAQRVTNNKSIEFADVLTTELADVTALVRNTRRFAGFVVLKSPDVPSVLLELGYLSNPTDAANLARPDYRDKLARATLRAIDRYFAELDAAL